MHAVIKFINIKSEIRISLEFNSLTNFISVSRTVERVVLGKTKHSHVFGETAFNARKGGGKSEWSISFSSHKSCEHIIVGDWLVLERYMNRIRQYSRI